jgi:hypothetical protein
MANRNYPPSPLPSRLSIIRTALKLAARGLHIFPCRPWDKRPATAHGSKDATTDIITIQAWWQGNPDYNIGIATGAASGLFVVDLDGDGADDGDDELRRLIERHGKLPPTVEVITTRGRHLWFRYPNVPVRNSAGKVAPGIDVRGDGGYVLAPPSVHPSGKRYCWSVDSTPTIAEAPTWLIHLIAAPASGNGATAPSEWHTLITDGVVEGRRDCTIAKLAGLLLRRFIDPIVTLELLRSWNATHCSPPLPPQDIERIVDSIAGRELRRRGGG